MQKDEKKRGIKSTLFSRHAKAIGIVSTVLIIIISYSLFFYLQNITEDNVKKSLFEQQRERQMEYTKTMAQHISSDLQSVMYILQGLADSSYLQQGELYGDRVDRLMRERFDQINSTTKVDGLFITDNDDVIVYHLVTPDERSFVNIDISFRDYVQKTRETLRPVFSNGFKGIDGVYRIALTYPIIDRESDQYVGLVGVQIPTIDFFARYGNVYDLDLRFLVAYDSNANYIATPRTQFLGKNYFSDDVQKFFNYTDTQNDYYRKVFGGQLEGGYAVYDFGSGERLNTGYPIFVREKPASYFVFAVTPTASIYSNLKEVLFAERLKMFSLIAGTTAAILVLILFLIKWNTMLNSQVKRRTEQLEESNKKLSISNQQLALTNEQLKVRDKMQKEFINIAAHELRTPIQPIISSSDVLLSKIKDSKYRELLDIVSRNATRLRRLAEDILDVSKIESHSLLLHKEQFNINDVIGNIVQGYQNQILEGQNKVRSDIEILFTPKEDVLWVEADKGRLTQVISNLLDNSLKFTKPTIRIRKEGDGEGDGEGDREEKEKITVTTERKDNQVTVSIKDTGTGIHPEILPRLFTKFASKSFAGTGLGLYISKSIIEEHGGKIWAENNSDGRGATFSFVIPSEQQPYPDRSGEIEE